MGLSFPIMERAVWLYKWRLLAPSSNAFGGEGGGSVPTPTPTPAIQALKGPLKEGVKIFIL